MWALLNALGYEFLVPTPRSKSRVAVFSAESHRVKAKTLDNSADDETTAATATNSSGLLAKVVVVPLALAIPAAATSLGVWWWRRVQLGLAESTCSQD